MVRSQLKRSGYVPDRGHAVWLDFDPQTGHEQAGRRAALVISPAGYNGPTGLAVVCPVTQQAKGYPFEVPVPQSLARKLKGVVLTDAVKNLDWRERDVDFICNVPDQFLDAVLEKLLSLIDPVTGDQSEH
jgi:mRNA interferase MazF